jgi:hypothetical protein
MGNLYYNIMVGIINMVIISMYYSINNLLDIITNYYLTLENEICFISNKNN